VRYIPAESIAPPRDARMMKRIVPTCDLFECVVFMVWLEISALLFVVFGAVELV